MASDFSGITRGAEFAANLIATRPNIADSLLSGVTNGLRVVDVFKRLQLAQSELDIKRLEAGTLQTRLEKDLLLAQQKLDIGAYQLQILKDAKDTDDRHRKLFDKIFDPLNGLSETTGAVSDGTENLYVSQPKKLDTVSSEAVYTERAKVKGVPATVDPSRDEGANWEEMSPGRYADRMRMFSPRTAAEVAQVVADPVSPAGVTSVNSYEELEKIRRLLVPSTVSVGFLGQIPLTSARD